MRIYVDHNAMTPVHPQVVEAVSRVLRDDFGNASSAHLIGQTAKFHVDQARAAVAILVGARPQEIVLTSGGTDSDNLTFRGLAAARAQTNRPPLIASSIQHEAVLTTTLKTLAKCGWTTTIPAGRPQRYRRPGQPRGGDHGRDHPRICHVCEQ